MEGPQSFTDLLHDLQSLGNALMGLPDGLQLVEDVSEDELDHPHVLESSSSINGLLDCRQEALLLMLPDRYREVVLHILQLPEQHLELIEVIQGIGQGKQSSNQLHRDWTTSFCLATMVWNCCWLLRSCRL